MRHSTYLEINLGLLGENFHLIKDLAPHAQVLPMVKADAYGNGIAPVTDYLAKNCGVKVVGCATLGEAQHLKKTYPDLKVTYLVFSDTELHNKDLHDAYLGTGIIPVLYQKSDLELVFNDPKFASLPLHIKLNTGMHRLGFTIEELEPYFHKLKNRGISHLITHFARTSQLFAPGDKTHKQYDEFLRMKKILLDNGITIQETSVSNSGAVEQGFGVDETYIRPGLMLYGPPSVTQPVLWKGHQISKLVTKVMTTFIVKKGTPVGYGVNVADKDSFMAVLSIGYGDGLLTYYSGSKISINGIQGKIFGRINMDMAFVQFDPDCENKIKNGDIVEIWNHDPRVITDLADQNKTIPYQLMCGISLRVPRKYIIK